MWELVTAWILVLESNKRMNFKLEGAYLVSKAWEDNVVAENMANGKDPMMSPRTKNIGIKYYWFREMIRPNEIEISRINTKHQIADFFTKSLTQFIFEYRRKLVMG